MTHTPPTPWTKALDPNGETYTLLDATGFPQAYRVSAEAAELILAAVNGRDWRDMDSAPKDGTKIDLLYPLPRGRAVDCFWLSEGPLAPGWFWLEAQWEKGRLLPEEQWARVHYPNMQPLAWMPAPRAALADTGSERQQRADNAAMGDDEGRS